MKIMYEELTDVKMSITSERLNAVSNFNSVTTSIDGLSGNRNLLGNGWISTVTHLKAYQEIDKALFNIYYEMEDSLASYLTDFVEEVGKTDALLDTEDLAELYRELQTAQNDYTNLMHSLAKSMKDVPILGEFFKQQSIEPIKEEIEILQKYQAFEASHAAQYYELTNLINDVNTGLAQLGNPANFLNPRDGYRVIDYGNQQWYKNITTFNAEKTIDRVEVIEELDENEKINYIAYRNGVVDQALTAKINEESFLDKTIDVIDKFLNLLDDTLKIVGGGTAVVTGIVGGLGGAAVVVLSTGGYGLVVDGAIVAQGATVAAVGAMYFNEGLDSLGNEPTKVKNVYDSVKDAPQYPEGFKGRQNGTKSVKMNDKKLLEQLRKIESGEWKKITKMDTINSERKFRYITFKASQEKFLMLKLYQNGVIHS